MQLREEFDQVAHDARAQIGEIIALLSEASELSEEKVSALRSLLQTLKQTGAQVKSFRELLLRSDKAEVEEPSELTPIGWKDPAQLGMPRVPSWPPEEGLTGQPPQEFLEQAKSDYEKLREDQKDQPEDQEGASGVPVEPITPVPVLAGGAARTFGEAEEPPRNP